MTNWSLKNVAVTAALGISAYASSSFHACAQNVFNNVPHDKKLIIGGYTVEMFSQPLVHRRLPGSVLTGAFYSGTDSNGNAAKIFYLPVNDSAALGSHRAILDSAARLIDSRMEANKNSAGFLEIVKPETSTHTILLANGVVVNNNAARRDSLFQAANNFPHNKHEFQKGRPKEDFDLLSIQARFYQLGVNAANVANGRAIPKRQNEQPKQ